jgi:Flp pilus assembly pilin Flp
MYLKLLVKMQELVNREEGQSLVEYAMLVSLISLAAVAISGTLGQTIKTVLTNINTSLT